MLPAPWIPQYLALDTIFRAIAVKRRRALLYRLLAGPEPQPVAIEDVVSFVTVWETLDEARVGSQATGDDEHRCRVATSLLHGHLPYLAEQAIIDYDRQNDTVVATERADDLEAILTLTRHAEHIPEADR